jgi:hypothetical protein
MKTLKYHDSRPVEIGDKFQVARWGTCTVESFDELNECATARNTQTGEEFDLLGQDTFGEADLLARAVRPLNADAGLYKHHCGMKPYTDAEGVIRESYQALDGEGKAIATLSMTGGELDDHATVTPPTPLHRIALEAWAAQIGEDYARRNVERETAA